jgi:hypothetical protein
MFNNKNVEWREIMKQKKNYSVFNNFNKNFREFNQPNYFDEYVNEFSEELFNRMNFKDEAKRDKKDAIKEHNSSNSPRNGESNDD